MARGGCGIGISMHMPPVLAGRIRLVDKYFPLRNFFISLLVGIVTRGAPVGNGPGAVGGLPRTDGDAPRRTRAGGHLPREARQSPNLPRHAQPRPQT
ncbi:hypothetical protein CH063_14522 [Colletotrichum higginsianum]|uniref:Uncharacterized protein n=1 Tax=Colletotrichum higginsianum (strain IMI 349063) TaxID=759273 RepID=H1VYX1_COLHI|nr:hypothetical protein CH063_14522 [Colletotrichum higginsianum]